MRKKKPQQQKQKLKDHNCAKIYDENEETRKLKKKSYKIYTFVFFFFLLYILFSFFVSFFFVFYFLFSSFSSPYRALPEIFNRLLSSCNKFFVFKLENAI
jgi:hypothetical protein